MQAGGVVGNSGACEVQCMVTATAILWIRPSTDLRRKYLTIDVFLFGCRDSGLPSFPLQPLIKFYRLVATMFVASSSLQTTSIGLPISTLKFGSASLLPGNLSCFGAGTTLKCFWLYRSIVVKLMWRFPIGGWEMTSLTFFVYQPGRFSLTVVGCIYQVGTIVSGWFLTPPLPLRLCYLSSMLTFNPALRPPHLRRKAAPAPSPSPGRAHSISIPKSHPPYIRPQSATVLP